MSVGRSVGRIKLVVVATFSYPFPPVRVFFHLHTDTNADFFASAGGITTVILIINTCGAGSTKGPIWSLILSAGFSGYDGFGRTFVSRFSRNPFIRISRAAATIRASYSHGLRTIFFSIGRVISLASFSHAHARLFVSMSPVANFSSTVIAASGLSDSCRTASLTVDSSVLFKSRISVAFETAGAGTVDGVVTLGGVAPWETAAGADAFLVSSTRDSLLWRWTTKSLVAGASADLLTAASVLHQQNHIATPTNSTNTSSPPPNDQ